MAALRIGVFIESVQLTDITCIDLLGNCSKEYITVAAQFGFGHFLPVAVPMEFLYIGPSMDPCTLTPSVKVLPTHTYDSAPRDLDILVVGGPPLNVRSEPSLRYLREAAKGPEEGGCKVIMSTCVGGLWLADAGVLGGKKATTNRGALPMAKQFHTGVEWLDQRWVVDESGPCKFWTSGGAGAGKFSPSISDVVCGT
jgi:transcriptional regulator GlxA family with amidase domain